MSKASRLFLGLCWARADASRRTLFFPRRASVASGGGGLGQGNICWHFFGDWHFFLALLQPPPNLHGHSHLLKLGHSLFYHNGLSFLGALTAGARPCGAGRSLGARGRQPGPQPRTAGGLLLAPQQIFISICLGFLVLSYTQGAQGWFCV